MKNKLKMLKIMVLLALVILYYGISAVALTPSFDQLVDGMKISLVEDSLFAYTVNATDGDGDYPLIFSDDSETKMAVFSMVAFNTTNNNKRAVINFTPTESDVLDSGKNVSNYHISIIVKDQTFATSVVDVLFNISNVNDAPNITSFTPTNTTPSVQENSSITFSFDNTTADPDLVHPGEDNISNTWLLNGSINSTNVSWAYTPGFCDANTYNVTLVVNDSHSLSGFNTWIITVTGLNRLPLNNATISNITWVENNNRTNNLTLKAYFNDSDTAECSGSNKDTLTYGYTSYGVTNSINSSKSVNVSIDQATGNVSFYVETNWYGIEIIQFYANDSYNITYSNNVTLNITPVNSVPSLQNIPNQTLLVGTLFTYDVNATDPDNDTLSYSSNATIFTINSTTGIINFTPSAGDVGNYTINMSVNDSALINSQIVLFTISNTTPNNPPIIQYIYPYGNGTSNLTIYGWVNASLYPNGTTIYIYENTTVEFKQNNSDLENDTLTYQWLLNGSLVNTTQNLTYYFNFTSAGIINLTVNVSDGTNATSFHWNINITNVNRPVVFGTKTYTTYSDFLGGTINNTNITAQPGNITLSNSSGAYLNGTYISPSIDLGANDDKLNFTSISWSQYLPDGANITLKTRTSSTSAGLSSSQWSNDYPNSTTSIINSTNKRYIQFRANLTTNNNTNTPVLHEAIIYYGIDTPGLLEDYIYENWVDLDNYFEELDTDDNVSFGNTAVTNVNVSINQNDHTVKLSFDANWYGTRTFRFYANDSYSLSYSNNITLVVQDVADDASTTTVVSGGGGGGVSTQTKIRKVAQYKYSQLLVPGLVSVISPNTVKIPILVENNIDSALKDIYLSAESEEGISFEFDESFISELGTNDTKTVNLIATSSGKSEQYTITVNAKVKSPSLNDSAIVQINPLENATTKIEAVMDMLQTYPECLELNELVAQARLAISRGQYEKANNLLEEAVKSCRFILEREAAENKNEAPSPNILILPWSILALVFFAATATFYFTRKKRARAIKNINKKVR